MEFVVPVEPTHPAFPLPTQEEFDAIVSAYGQEGWNEIMRARNLRIEAELKDPFAYGVELPAWLLADWCLGRISWEDFCASKGCVDSCKVPDEWKTEELKKTFEGDPARLLLILGGTGSAKTEYMLKRIVSDARDNPYHVSWVFHESKELSVDYHQNIVYKYLPANWKTAGKGSVGYVSYKQKTGFAEGNFIGANGSNMRFRTYEQDIKTIESGKLGAPTGKRTIGFCADELCPLKYLQTLRGRLASRNASGIFGFTPLQGYSDVVAWFRNGAKTVLSRRETDIASPVDVPLVEVKKAVDKKFEPMKIAVVYFHSKYSPYANYEGLKQLYGSDSDAVRLIRYDGFCKQEKQNLFPKLSKAVHGFKIEDLPKNGTRYYFLDPCGIRRNWAMIWVLIDAYNRAWIYREWPCPNIPIPGYGRIGPWAEEGQTAAHKFGGVPGAGSVGLGFGIPEYKNEIMRLEGWKDYYAQKPVLECDELNGADEQIYWREIDSRFADTAKNNAEGNTTLLDELQKAKIYCKPTSGARIEEGIKLINLLLAYKENWQTPEDGPKLFICEDCANVWFALQNYTALGGGKEASKDFADLVRYLAKSAPPYISENAEPVRSRLALSADYFESATRVIDKNRYFGEESQCRM